MDELVYGAEVIDCEKTTEFLLNFLITEEFLAQSSLPPSMHIIITFFFNGFLITVFYMIFTNFLEV